jgi:hypothetical protein
MGFLAIYKYLVLAACTLFFNIYEVTIIHHVDYIKMSEYCPDSLILRYLLVS